jgi:hypothetical protein
MKMMTTVMETMIVTAAAKFRSATELYLPVAKLLSTRNTGVNVVV